MSEMRDMMLDGTLCQACGVFIEAPNDAGVPRDCKDCGQHRARANKPRTPKPAKTIVPRKA